MLRKMCLATAAAGILAAGLIATMPAPAEARSGCAARAEVLFPYNKAARKAYRQRCRARYRVWRRANRGVWLFP